MSIPCQQVWNLLSRTRGLQDLDRDGPSADDVKSFNESTPVDALSLDCPDDLARLTDIGVSRSLALALLDTDNSIIYSAFRAYLRWVRPCGPLDRLYRKRSVSNLSVQERVIRQGYYEIACPLTGRRARSNASFVVDHLDVLYRFNTTDTYYVCSIGPSNGGHLLLYFPTHEWLVFRQKPSAAIARDRIQSIKRARAFLVNNYRLVARYLNSTEARATVSVIGHPNYAHHLSNELQAVERLMQSQAIDSLDKLLVSRHALGRVEWLFPELDPAKIEYREEGNEAFFAANLRENNFVIKIGDNYVSSELQHRVTRAAAQHAEPRRDLALCRGGSLDTRTVLWISIKCGDRTLVDQSSFLTGLIRNIHTHRSDLLVLFDGVSLPCDHSDVHGGRIFKKEFIEEHRRVIEEIGQHLDADGIEWISLNGKTLLETIWWTRFVDLYFTHWGSIQHKIGWFSDCPGLAHGNSSILSKSKRLTEYLRSLGRPAPLFVPESFVEDFPCDVVDLRARGGVLMDNYMLDIDATARLLLRGLARTPHAR